MGRSGSGGKENTSLSAVISPYKGSRHQLPAEMGRFSLLATAGDRGEQMALLGPDSSQIAREVWAERRGWCQAQEYTRGGREPPLYHLRGVSPVWGGMVGTLAVALLVVLKPADAQSPLERDGPCLLRPGQGLLRNARYSRLHF